MTVDEDPVVARIARFWEARAREDARRFSLPGGIGDTGDAFTASGGDLLDFLAERLGWDVTGKNLVLDVGCGTGRVTGPLEDRATEVVGIDVSLTMLRRARELNPVAPRVRWEHRHAADLRGFDDERTDAILALGVLTHLPSVGMVADVLAEFARVLAPDGSAVFDVRTGPEPLRLPGEWPLPDRVAEHPIWRGCTVDLETLAALAHQEGLVVERIEGSETARALVLVRRDEF